MMKNFNKGFFKLSIMLKYKANHKQVEIYLIDFKKIKFFSKADGNKSKN